ncbi:hypothetical protein [Bacillus sp. REN3]|uniref:hypothetical protein n=1 Tax=Bacillus sp. REN3 TaxID=2802440 RepID=UPI001AEE7AC3|nr:hypothetical protein [Bacillus sp. REN3]
MEREYKAIKSYEADGYEINIHVANLDPLLENDEVMREIALLAAQEGYLRFVGAIDPSSYREDWTFIFSKEGYFDNDDMLVRHKEAEAKITPILEEVKRNSK